jgi:hypothetical protein
MTELRQYSVMYRRDGTGQQIWVINAMSEQDAADKFTAHNLKFTGSEATETIESVQEFNEDDDDEHEDETESDLPKPNGEFMAIMVLNDSETFTSFIYCDIVIISDNWDTGEIEIALAEEDDNLMVITTFAG